MQAMERCLRGFSCPASSFDNAAFGLIISAHANESTTRFLDAFQTELRSASDGLVEFLEYAVNDGLEPEVAWDPSFSHLFRAVQRSLHAPVVQLAAFAGLRLAACGRPAKWRANWDAHPVQLRWANCLLPYATSISVFSDGQTATVVTECAEITHEVRLERSTNRWITSNCESLAMVAARPSGFALLPHRALLPHEAGELDPLIPSTDVPSDIQQMFSGACDLIATSAPNYLPWISRVIRCVALVEPPRQDVMASGSMEWSCGLIHVSQGPGELALAETLVHEACHQYFHIATRLGPIDDGSDSNTYYSPVVEAGRPLSRILLAYHAFANVLLFYRNLIAEGVEEEQCAQAADAVQNQLRVLLAPLSRNSALTFVGRALFLPLSETLT